MVARSMPPPHGFTLIELLVTIAVLGIIVAAGAPPLRASVQERRGKDMMSALTSDLNWARARAISRNQSVSLVPGGANSCTWTVQVAGVALDGHGMTEADVTTRYNGVACALDATPVFNGIGVNTGGALNGTITAGKKRWTITVSGGGEIRTTQAQT